VGGNLKVNVSPIDIIYVDCASPPTLQ